MQIRLSQLGAREEHAARLLRNWSRGLALEFGRRPAASFFPRRLSDALAEIAAELAALASIASRHPAPDGSERLLVRLADGQCVESVLLPRQGLCVSTQIGCAVGCRFCATGQSGLLRQLASLEIVAQVVLARALREVRKVVFMGMGEPAHNLDAVLEAIAMLGQYADIAHKNLVFSTVGDRRVFERLPLAAVKPALAISLHTTKTGLRAELLPQAPRLTPEELIALGENYARATGYPIQYQWTLLKGVNDGDDEIEALARLLAGKYAVMNFIPYNSVAGGEFARPDAERAAAMSLALYRRGVLTKLRQSAGEDIDGACGQLRARSLHALSA
ncbi:MAG: RNA methyltransferase [Burkholderiales bacterium]|nr:MAG: RNA methyltransferase [Burkholderiales bacterium]